MKTSNHVPKTLRQAALTAGLLSALLVGADASAQTYAPCHRDPTPSDVEGAKGAHKAAEAHYNKGAYERAIQAWVDAYGFDCTAHRLLINIGNAYEKLGKLPEAIEAFETYLERTGADADPTIEDKVQNLKTRLQRQSSSTPSPTPTGTATGPGPPPPPPPPDDGADDGGPGIGPWIVVGAGGVVTVVGVALLVVGRKKVSDAEAQCTFFDNARGEWVCPPAVADEGTTGRTLTGVGGTSIGIGLAAVAGGLVWYFLADADDDEPDATARTQLLPVLGPSTAGLSLSGTF